MTVMIWPSSDTFTMMSDNLLIFLDGDFCDSAIHLLYSIALKLEFTYQNKLFSLFYGVNQSLFS